jgi:hypothetical protein
MRIARASILSALAVAVPEEVAAVVRSSPAEAARRLSEQVRLSSGRLQDDFAVVVARRARLD